MIEEIVLIEEVLKLSQKLMFSFLFFIKNKPVAILVTYFVP